MGRISRSRGVVPRHRRFAVSHPRFGVGDGSASRSEARSRTMYIPKTTAMSPADFIHALSIVNERLKTARTVAISLLAFAAAGARRHVRRPRDRAGDGKDDGRHRAHRRPRRDRRGPDPEPPPHGDPRRHPALGFRHVGGPDVGRRAAELVHIRRRRQLADTLERFVEVAATNHPCSVPLHRPALREMAPQVRELTARLREPSTEVQASGMVLVRRLVTDGAVSPIFAPVGSRPAIFSARSTASTPSSATTGSTRTTTRAPSFGSPPSRAGSLPDLEQRRRPAPFEAARDDQPLDLRRPLPDPVDAQLAPQPLGRVLAHVAAARRRSGRCDRRHGPRSRRRRASPSRPCGGRAFGRRRCRRASPRSR